jgi:leucyl aminopeptidase
MRIIFTILIVLFVIVATKHEDFMRLIEINNKRIWVHKDSIEKLAAKAGELINFVDVTETQDLEKGPVLEPSTVIPQRPTQQSVVKPLCEKIDSETQPRLTASITHLSSYRTRHATTETGVQAAHWFRDQFQAIINSLPAARRSLFSVRLYPHTNWRQPSVIATMKGSSAELVILGGHEDSTASGGIAPGADDDASGSASVLESFRIIANSNFVPTKTVEFHCYAAEEMGLLGSRAIAQEYKNRNARVFGMMQLDMTGFGNNNVGVITNGVNAELTEFSRKLITEYLRIRFVNRTLIGGSSDHASWIAAGYKACFPFEQQTNPNIHTARDTIDKLNLRNAIEWVKLGVSFVIEMIHN